ncbi:hypothetical protein NQZ68_013762 [Dissostichus eleginoides]|nr:hypothetical protein NQZ68_013762 [Dissostichus eleginoides]
MSSLAIPKSFRGCIHYWIHERWIIRMRRCFAFGVALLPSRGHLPVCNPPPPPTPPKRREAGVTVSVTQGDMAVPVASQATHS